MASEFRQTLRQILPDRDKNGQEQFENETGINVEAGHRLASPPALAERRRRRRRPLRVRHAARPVRRGPPRSQGPRAQASRSKNSTAPACCAWRTTTTNPSRTASRRATPRRSITQDRRPRLRRTGPADVRRGSVGQARPQPQRPERPVQHRDDEADRRDRRKREPLGGRPRRRARQQAKLPEQIASQIPQVTGSRRRATSTAA